MPHLTNASAVWLVLMVLFRLTCCLVIYKELPPNIEQTQKELKPEPLNFDLFNSSIEALKENPIDFVSYGKGKSFFKACGAEFILCYDSSIAIFEDCYRKNRKYQYSDSYYHCDCQLGKKLASKCAVHCTPKYERRFTFLKNEMCNGDFD